MANVSKQYTWADFSNAAAKVAKETGFPVGVILSQAALETARGKSAPGNNFFGIKGAGTAGSQNLQTWEDYGNGPVTTNAGFAAYNSPEDSIMAYLNLIKNNYPKAWAARKDPVATIQAIKAGGYATDPQYVAKVMSMPEFGGKVSSGTNVINQTRPVGPAAAPSPYNAKLSPQIGGVAAPSAMMQQDSNQAAQAAIRQAQEQQERAREQARQQALASIDLQMKQNSQPVVAPTSTYTAPAIRSSSQMAGTQAGSPQNLAQNYEGMQQASNAGQPNVRNQRTRTPSSILGYLTARA